MMNYNINSKPKSHVFWTKYQPPSWSRSLVICLNVYHLHVGMPNIGPLPLALLMCTRDTEPYHPNRNGSSLTPCRKLCLKMFSTYRIRWQSAKDKFHGIDYAVITTCGISGDIHRYLLGTCLWAVQAFDGSIAIPIPDHTISSMIPSTTATHSLFGRAPIMFGNSLHKATSSVAATPAPHVAQFM